MEVTMQKHKATSEAFRRYLSSQLAPFADIKATWHFDECDGDSRTLAMCKWVKPHLRLERILANEGPHHKYWLILRLKRNGEDWKLEAILSFQDSPFRAEATNRDLSRVIESVGRDLTSQISSRLRVKTYLQKLLRRDGALRYTEVCRN